jgi:hypothetical protein
MPNPPRPDLARKAICAGAFTGNVDFADNAYRQLQDDPDLKRFTPVGVKKLLRDFVCNQRGNVDTRNQGFEHWLEEDPNNPYWYRVVIPVSEFPKGLFVEIVIADYDPDDPWVLVVSVHEQKS